MIKTIQVFIILIVVSLSLYSATNKVYEVLSNKCTGCSDCIDVCPKDAIKMSRGKAVIDPELCGGGCPFCNYICSFGAVRYGERR